MLYELSLYSLFQIVFGVSGAQEWTPNHLWDCQHARLVVRAGGVARGRVGGAVSAAGRRQGLLPQSAAQGVCCMHVGVYVQPMCVHISLHSVRLFVCVSCVRGCAPCSSGVQISVRHVINKDAAISSTLSTWAFVYYTL